MKETETSVLKLRKAIVWYFSQTQVCQMHADIFYIKTDVSKYITLYSKLTIIKYFNMTVALVDVSVDFLIKME